MTFKSIDWEKLGLNLTATVLAGRGIWETFVLVFRTNEPSQGILLSMVMMVSISMILFAIGRSLKRRQELGWRAALITALILAISDVIFTLFGSPQLIFEYLIDAWLIGYLMINRELFLSGEAKTINDLMRIK